MTLFRLFALSHFKPKRRTDDNDIELEAALQELVFNLLCDGVETNVSRRTDFLDICCGHCLSIQLEKSV